MNTYIALLKGINVGGHRKVPMAELRELLAKVGFKDVRTYIQSGNVVLKSSEKSNEAIEDSIQKAIAKHFGFEVFVMIKTRNDLKRIFDNCPFSEEKKKSSYFTILHSSPSEDMIAEASQKIYENEEYTIIDDCIYYYCEKGYAKAKFNMNYFERKLNTTGTTRNYNTMVKLIEMSSEEN
ncbi:DUF1697 domain-containing protein [Winogradskyella sp. 3972H.M.0a.05]|uniref:DUF1697 domain-containing protein n=1 Tax=Winogradskyella sp. 3972H.M.0a.05 TaxID=2950277 RepID=UPI003398597D